MTPHQYEKLNEAGIVEFVYHEIGELLEAGFQDNDLNFSDVQNTVQIVCQAIEELYGKVPFEVKVIESIRDIDLQFIKDGKVVATCVYDGMANKLIENKMAMIEDYYEF